MCGSLQGLEARFASFSVMARPRRRYQQGRLYEATIKTFQARYFLIPSKLLNLLVIGALAHAQKLFGLRICYVVALTNHIHCLYRGDVPDVVAGFFCLANSQISKEVQKFCSWTGGIFGESMTVSEVTAEPAAQIGRLKYLLAQGVKEGLAPHPTLWPGVQAAKAWLDGSMKLRGLWIRRSELYELERTAARKLKAKPRRLSRAARKRCEDQVTLELSPLPCCDGWSRSQLMELAQQLCDEILEEHAEARARITMGWRKRLMDPALFCFRPEGTKKGDRPKVHAASEESWIEWVREWEDWKLRYERAFRRLRNGIAAALGEFPEGAFLPTGIFRSQLAGVPPPG